MVSLQNGQLRNVESARVSMAGQLKNVTTGDTATLELENHTISGRAASGSVEEDDSNAIREDEEATFKVPVSMGMNLLR